jgi:hypothetical protein
MSIEGYYEKRSRSGTVYYENELGEIIAKRCTKCSEAKMLDSFSRKKDGLAGKRTLCNECEKKRAKEYREENLDKVVERNRKYREENRDILLEKQKKWCKDNPEQKAENDRKYRENNREKCAEATRTWYKENKVHKISYNRKWVEENHELHAGFLRKWRKDNPNRSRAFDLLRRARKASLPDTFTAEQMSETLKRFNGGCALTGSINIHWDHAIPLTTGKGGTTFENMIPLRSDLNLSKSDSNLFEWFNLNKERFELDVSQFNKLVDYLAEINGMSADQYRQYYYSCFVQDKLVP